MFHDLRAPNRIAPTLAQRINPLWWLGDELRPSSAGPVAWFFRNPAVNLCAVIIGISHRTRMVTYARGDGHTHAPQGWNWGWSVPLRGHLPRPFVSYRGVNIRWISLAWSLIPKCIRRIDMPEWVEVATLWKTSGTFTLLQIRAANAHQVEAL